MDETSLLCAGRPLTTTTKKEIQHETQQTGGRKKYPPKDTTKNITYLEQKVSVFTEGPLTMGLLKMASVHLTDDDSGDDDNDDNNGYGM